MQVRTSGLTLVEVLVVTLILLLIAGLWFGLSSGTRESANQRVCGSNMRQVYLGLSLYSGDHDNGSQYPELHGLTYVCELFRFEKNGTPRILIGERDLYICPSTPAALRAKVFKTMFVMVDGCPSAKRMPGGAMTTGDRNRAKNVERERLYGSDVPILFCTIHDEFVYAPQDPNVDPMVAVPFIVSLSANGSLKARRDNRFHRKDTWRRIP